MRFALAFVAILVVSWASNGEGGVFSEGSTGAKQSVKELSALFESSRVVNPKSDENDAEVITETGATTSVKNIIDSYEKFQSSDTLKESGKVNDVPTIQEVIEAIKTGLKFGFESALCKLGAGSPSGNPTNKLYEFLCF